MPVLNLLQKNLLVKSKGLNEICEKNRHTLQFLLTMAELKRANTVKECQDLSDSEDSSDNDDSQNIEDMELESKWDNDSE